MVCAAEQLGFMCQRDGNLHDAGSAPELISFCWSFNTRPYFLSCGVGWMCKAAQSKSLKNGEWGSTRKKCHSDPRVLSNTELASMASCSSIVAVLLDPQIPRVAMQFRGSKGPPLKNKT